MLTLATWAHPGEMEVIIAADALDQICHLVPLKDKIPFLHFTASGHYGVSAARNRGLSLARGKVFLLVDDDCQIQSQDFLNQICKIAQDSQEVHGGTYKLSTKGSYWARVYNWVNKLWLQLGQNPQGPTSHLLGGFLFGSQKIISKVSFSSQLTWGGEEKEMLLRIRENHGIKAKFHPNLSITHFDSSGFRKFIKRAYRQGLAAGQMSLYTPGIPKIPSAPITILPGLVVFYIFSRWGVFVGKLKKAFQGNVKVAESSPIA